MSWSLRGVFPLLRTLQGYTRDDMRADLAAGGTTAVMMVPQGMAYAMLAGVPPIYGVYAALLPGIAYAWLGTSRQLSVGPVAMDSLLVASTVGSLAQVGTDAYVSAVISLALMVGAIQVAMGGLRLGVLVNFLSAPVVSGFTSAAAILIGLSQVKHLLGLEFHADAHLVALVSAAWSHVSQVDGLTLALGLASIALILALKRVSRRIPGALIAVSLGAVLVGGFDLQDRLQVVGEVERGLPDIRVPTWNWTLIKQLAPSALTIALVSFMETIAVGRIYGKRDGYEVLADRELMAVGASNLGAGLLQGFPVAGGFSRTAVNAEAGARTSIAALVTSLLVGVALLVLTPAFALIPRLSLAAVIVTAVVSLVDYREAAELKRIERYDWAILLVTFAATLLLGVVNGIGIGVVGSILSFMVRTSRPHVAVLGRLPGTKVFKNVLRHPEAEPYPGVLALRMDARLYFANAGFLKSTLRRLEEDSDEPLQAVVMDFSSVNSVDSSAVEVLRELLRAYRRRDVEFYLASVKGPVRDVMNASDLSREWGEPALCVSVHEALERVVRTKEPRGCARAEPSRCSGAVASFGASRL